MKPTHIVKLYIDGHCMCEEWFFVIPTRREVESTMLRVGRFIGAKITGAVVEKVQS